MRFLFPLLIGLCGAAVLVSLGTWQVQRLSWKEGVLAQIDARIGAAPVAIPADPDPDRDAYLPVEVTGTIEPQAIKVLASLKQVGAIHRYILPFETSQGRRILIDLGYRSLTVADARYDVPLEPIEMTIIGNLHWPDDKDNWTPEPDARTGVHFARDLDLLSDQFETQPLLVVARSFQPTAGLGVTPLPVTSDGIPNDHLQYAVTWFGLAIVWVGMTALWLWRRRGKAD